MVETSPAKQTQLASLLPNLSAGLVIGFTTVIIAISLAGLVFSGPLAVYLPRGIAIVLVTAAIHALFTAIFSSFDGTISSVQDNPSVLMAVAAMSLAGTLRSDAALFATIIGLFMVTTLLTGIFLYLIGNFGLGNLVRYIPYPVIGGFLAGTGWLLAQGSIGTMANYPLTLPTIPDLLRPDQLLLWLPGVAFGLVLFFGIRRIKHILTLPALLVGGLILFYIVLFLSGTSIETATQRGLLIGQVSGQAAWQLPFGELAQANWSAIAGQAGTIATIILLTAISLLLNISGLELALHKDLDLNRELRIVGVANLISGLAGGMIGYHWLSLSSLNPRMGSRGRMAGLVVGGVCLAVLVLGSSVLAYVPKPLLGGILLFLGLDFLDEWVIRGITKLSRIEYVVVLTILVIIAVFGFLAGVSVGLFLIVVLFVINYSRLNIFHRAVSGAEVVSNIERSTYHRRALTNLGQHIYILELQGFVFFGTSNILLEQIRNRLEAAEQVPLRFLVLDFRHVQGFDSSVAYSLNKVKYLAESRDFILVFTHLSEQAQGELARNGLVPSERVKMFPDLDYGLEWCENELLERDQITKMHIAASLEAQLADNGFEKEKTTRLKPYLEQVNFAPGEYLIRQHDPASDLYFVRIGQVSIYLEMGDDKRVRLQTLTMGTVVGELAFFLDLPRSASVIADEDTIAYRLTRQALEAMKAKDPELTIAFNEMMLRLVSERLMTTNQELVALNR